MLAVTLLSALAVVVAAQDTTVAGPVTGAQGNATIVEDNPPNVVYEARLPETAFTKTAFPRGGNIKGAVIAKAHKNGIGVDFSYEFTNLPEGGPFPWHIHDQPVPADGNCTATLAHLDPFQRGETPPCDQTLPQTCQVGDLAGKHGMLNGPAAKADFVDDFASTKQGIGAFFGNRSIVIHFPNKTRITCANFTLVSGTASLGASSPSTSAASNGSSSSSGSSSQSTATGSALAPTPTLATVAGAGATQATLWAVGAAWLFAAIFAL